MEISKLMYFVYKFDNSGALYIFLAFLKIMPRVSFIGLGFNKRVLLHDFSQKQMIFRLHSAIISLICNDFGGK